MYKITCDGEILHEPGLDNPTRLVFGARISQQANMADSLEFTIYPSNPGAAGIHKLTSTIEVYSDGALLFRGRPIQSKTGWENQVKYTCEGGLAMLNDTILRPYTFTGSVQEYLQMLLLQHNAQVPANKQFSLGTVTVTDPNNYIVRSNEEYVTTMTEIQDKLIGNLGGFLVPTYTGTGWRLDYLADSTEATAQKITLAKNLIDFLREQNAENIATALIPLGAVDEETGERITIKSVNSGLDYIVDQAAAAQYGLIFATETWDDVTLPANLLTKAQAKLTDYATLLPTIQLTAVDLSLTDQTIEPIRLLDKVTVEDDQHAASGQYIVMQRVYNLSAPENDSVTFGGNAPTISAKSAKTAAEVQDIPARVLQNASERARIILDDATNGAIQILYNQDGVAYELRINNSQDPATATRWWRYNSNGWGYTADGGQTYTVAATMDGALVANMITSGILKSDDGTTFYLDLDNGVLKGNFSELKISGAAAASQSYADGKANTAQSNAISTAASDATTKANAAQSAAISAAATDATNKANTAESNAISTAASNTANAISTYDTNLGQQAVFDKLTNNQANQGIYLDQGNLYINASMIQAGTFSGAQIDIGNGNFTVDSQGNATASRLSLSGASKIDLYSSSGNDQLHIDDDGFWAYDSANDHKINVSQDGITFGTGTLNYFTLYDTAYGGDLNVYSNDGGFIRLRANASATPFIDVTRITSNRGYRVIFLGGNVDGGGMLTLGDSYGIEQASITDGVLYLSKNGSERARLGRTTGGNGNLSLKDTNGQTRVSINDGGIYFYSASGTLTRWISNTGGNL